MPRWSRRTVGRRKRRCDGRPVTDAPCLIRVAQTADVPAVLAIERASFSDPWSRRAFQEAAGSQALFLVAERGGAVEGYVVARRVLDEGEILNLAVAPRARTRGVGRALARRALDELRAGGVTHVYLEVRSSNGVARRLYAGLGFREVGRRVGYYGRPTEDAVVLRAAVPTGEGDAKL